MRRYHPPRIVHANTGRRNINRRCEDPHCDKLTDGGKPFCKEHILGMPYARRLYVQSLTCDETLRGLSRKVRKKA